MAPGPAWLLHMAPLDPSKRTFLAPAPLQHVMSHVSGLRRSPDSPTEEPGVHLPLRDMRFDVRLIYEQCLYLPIQMRNKVDANTVHSAPDVYRPDGNKRRDVGDEAHLEVCA